MEPLDYMDPEPPIEVQRMLSEGPCPNCGDTGIGLLGIHEWVEPVGQYEEYVQFESMSQEEYGTPCPTCGRTAEEELDIA